MRIYTSESLKFTSCQEICKYCVVISNFNVRMRRCFKCFYWNLDQSCKIYLKNSNPFWRCKKIQTAFPRSGIFPRSGMHTPSPTPRSSLLVHGPSTQSPVPDPYKDFSHIKFQVLKSIHIGHVNSLWVWIAS